jgi:hypothetical protein
MTQTLIFGSTTEEATENLNQLLSAVDEGCNELEANISELSYITETLTHLVDTL